MGTRSCGSRSMFGISRDRHLGRSAGNSTRSSFNLTTIQPYHQLRWSQPNRQGKRVKPRKRSSLLLTAATNMKKIPQSLARCVAQSAPGPPKRCRRISNRGSGGRQPSYLCFLTCLLIFSTKCVDLPYGTSLDTKKFTDILSRPPERPDANLLDLEDSQWIPHQQVIATCLAGLIQDDPGEPEATTSSLRDYRNGIREPLVRPMLHGLCIGCQSSCPSV